MALAKSPSAFDLGTQVCKALGIDPDYAGRIIIDIPADGPIQVYTRLMASYKLLDIDWAAGLKEAELVTML